MYLSCLCVPLFCYGGQYHGQDTWLVWGGVDLKVGGFCVYSISWTVQELLWQRRVEVTMAQR